MAIISYNPYAVVRDVLQTLTRAGGGPFNTATFGDAAVFAAGLLAVLGVEPAVDGDATHPRCVAGLALLARYRADREV
jgi:hypothetical protein